MVIRTVCSAAIYCQECGWIQIHEVPFFAGRGSLVIRCQDCGHRLGEISYQAGGSFKLKLDCVSCGETHEAVYSMKKLKHTYIDRVICRKDGFELGYLGKHNIIEGMLSSSFDEYKALHPGETEETAKSNNRLLKAVNLLHDMAESGKLCCDCGCQDMSVDIFDGHIILECYACGRHSEFSPVSKAD